MTNVRARTIKGFCEAYGVGVTKAYALIGAGKIRTVKDGRKTLVLEDSARAWLESLHPAIHTLEPVSNEGRRRPAKGGARASDGND